MSNLQVFADLAIDPRTVSAVTRMRSTGVSQVVFNANDGISRDETYINVTDAAADALLKFFAKQKPAKKPTHAKPAAKLR